MTALAAELRAMIEANGPISLERFMHLALAHPRYGYYMSQMPFGAAGDFVTAPEISQMFGELIGLWAAEAWSQLGGPHPFALVELGPGRGTMMQDCLRSARVSQQFFANLDVHMIETSPRLRAHQQALLAGCHLPIHWHEDIAGVPPGPIIVLANEFFDALPVRHYIHAASGWHECCVTLGGDGEFAFAAAPQPEATITMAAPDGAMLEIGARAYQFMSALSQRIAIQGGAALVIDYGHLETTLGETLQAVRAHRAVNPLSDPGSSDLTAHVDFAALARAARAQGLDVYGPVTQAAFLRDIGIEQRAAALIKRANLAQAADIAAALARLTETGSGMGELFKVLAVATPGTGPLPGFATQGGPHG